MTSKIYYLLLIVFLTQCSDYDGNANRDNKSELKDTLSIHSALPQTVKSPSNNPSSPAKIELGRLLFYDPILSGNKDIACVSCHHPDQGYAEYRDMSLGTNAKGLGSKRVFNSPNEIPLMKKNADTILNTAFNGINLQNYYSPEKAPMFWDLRVESLEDQALEPILTLEEMRGSHFEKEEILVTVIQRLKNISEYVVLFNDAFKEPEATNSSNLAKAIGAFERTLVTTETRFDKYMRGDKDAISLSEKDGFEMFNKGISG